MNNFLSKISSSFSGSKGSFGRKEIKPAFDWSLILLSTIIIVLVLVGVSLFLYFGIEKNQLFSSANSIKETEIKINTNLLKKITTDLKDRQTRFSEIKTSRTIPLDPSL